MALPFKTYATIGDTRYRIFKPKEMPEAVFAYDTKQKTAHRIDDSVLKLLKIDKATFRPYNIPNVLMGMKAGQMWNQSWYQDKYKEKGPVKAIVETKVPELESVKWPDYKTFSVQKGYALVREKDTQEVYTLDPKTGQARWLTAEAVRPAGFDLTKVQEVPQGYVKQFKIADKWTKPKTKADYPSFEKSRELSGYQEKKEEEVKRWGFETRAKSAKAISGYADFLLSPVSFKTYKTTQAFIAPKPKDITKDEAIGKRVADYSVLAPEEKDRLDKQFMFEPIYGKKLIEQSNIEIQKIVSEEKQKAGFIDSETGEDKFPVALSIEQAIKEIEASNVVLTDLERLAIVKGKERLDVLREAGTYEGTFETLAKELERIEIEIVFESTKDSPDEDKMKSFEVQYKDKQKEVEKLQTKYKPLVAKLSTYNKELEEIEAKFENERARFTGDKMPTSWANYFALLEYNSNMDTRIKEWLKVEQKGIIQLYETGEINKLTAIELLNNSIPDPNLQFTNKSFDELIMPATKRRREQVLKYKITELGMSADELTTSWNVGKDYLKKSLKMAGKILWKGAELYAADLTIPFQLLQDAKEFKGMSMSLDALIEGLPSLEEVKKMSVNQRRIYLDSLVFISETADKTLADTPKLGSQKAEFLYMVKSIADKAWNPDWSEVDLYKAFEGDSWVPKEYQTQAKIAFGAALMFGLWKQGVWRHSQKNNAIYINLFKDINNKLASTKAPGWVGIKKDYGLAKYTGEALKNTLGKSFSTIANNKYGIPNVNNIITNAFAKSWPKIFPEGSKLGIKKIVTRSEIASQKQIDNIQKLFDNFTPTKEAREKLRKIMALEIVPDETYYKMTAPLIKNVSISNKISKTLEPLANQARKRKESSFIKLFPQIKANEELIITINKIKKNHPTDLLFKQLKNKPNTLAAELFKKYPKEVSTDLNNFLKKIRIKDLKSGDRLVVEAGLVPEHIKILKYSIKDLPFKTTDEVITFFKEANKGTRKIKVAVQSESAAAFEILSVLDPSLYGEIRKLVNLGLDIKKVPLVLRELAKGGKLKAEAKFIQEAKLMGEGVEKWLEPFVIELRISSESLAKRQKYLAYLRETQSKSVVDRIIKLDKELKSFYDRVRNIEGKLGKPVRIPWAKVKGVETYTWMLNEKEWRALKLPERAAGISDVLNGSKILAKISGIKAFGNPNKTFAVNFVRRGKALTIEDVSAVSFHENIHTIINFKSSNFYKGKPLNDFLIKNLERRISRNPELQRVLDTIAKVYFKNEKITPKIKERIMHEFYAFMIESSLAVKLNLRLRLRTIERISTQEKAELARAQNTFIKLAKKNQLLTPEERLIFFPQRLAEKQKRLIIKQYGRKNGDEMIDILEGGLEIDSTKIPYFEPYRKGYVEIKNPMIIKVQDKIMNHDIPRLMPGYQLPRINKKLDPYELVPGLMRSISRRMKNSKAEDFARVAKKMGYKDAKAIKLYTNNAIKTGVFPRINPIVYEFQSNPNAFINAIRQGHARRAQNIAKKQINKYLKKQVQKPYYNDQQKTAIEKWRRQFMGDAPIKDGSVKDTLSSLGLYKDISGVEATFLYDLQIVGGGKVYISGPLWLKNLGTGAWKSKNPEAASVFRGVMTVLNLPQTLWKYSVLFLRPGWGVRNIMDNSLKMGIATESGQKAQSWKMIAASMTPLGWKKVRRELQAATGIGKQFESTTMFVSENPTFNNQAMKALSFWLMDRTGAFGKYANRAFQTFLKKKRGLENIYTQTEVLAKEALMYNAVFKYADDAVKTLWDDIIKMQNSQKDILLELRSLVPGKKNYNKISAIAQKVMEGKLTKVDEKWILAMARKYKMKDGAILEKGFKEVTRVLFDYSDLSKAGKSLRWIYPFWGFFSKNFTLWTQTVVKDPGLRKAATFYLKKVEEANSDLPDWYKRRTKIFGDWYTLPFFSYQQVADVWLDPYKEFVAWTENANHPISGLGWNPSISVAIKKFTGKGYFSSEKDLKSLGYTDEMLKRMGQENIDLEKNNNVWAIYARQIPIFQLISIFQTVTDEMLNTIDSAVGSKKMNAFSSYFFGVPIIKIDDLNKLWGAYNRMLPQDRTKFLAALPEGQYENFYKLLAVKNLQKILDATAAGIKDPIYYQYMYDWQYRNEYFRILEMDGKKEANYYLAINKAARGAVNRYWDILEFSPKRAATEYIYNKNQVRGVIYEVLKQLNSELQKGMKTRPAEWYAITGEGYEVAYTKEDLERDLLNEDGTVKPETLKELQAMMPELKKLPWLKKVVEESISKSEEFPEEYYRMIIETDKEEEDYKYAIEMMTFGKTIYIASDVPSTEQARGAALRAGYNLWDNMSDTTKAMHLERYPAKHVWHEFKSSYTKKLGVMTSQNQLENWYENFYNNKFFGPKDREVYFIKHPDRKAYYPAALENAKLRKIDELNQAKGEFTSLAWDYLKTIDSKAKTAWERDKPQFWESYKWHDGYQILIKAGRFDDAVEYYWGPKYKGARDRYFLKNPEQKKFREKQRTYWSMSQNTWEERSKALDWWFANPDYIEWTHRFDITDQQKEDSLLRDRIKKINHEIKSEGSGKTFYDNMAKLEAEKRMIYEQNTQLQEEFEKGLKGDAKKEYELTQEFFDIDVYDFEAKQKFLAAHPEIKQGWVVMTPPWERKLLDLQAKYFELKTSANKEKFLKGHPELVQYWDSKSLPWSFWFDKSKFKQDQAMIISISGSIIDDKPLTDKEKEVLRNPKDEDEKYIANKVYQWSMGKWIEFGRTDTTKGWEFFEGLPKTIRDIYFLKNPKMKQYFSFTSEWHKKLQIDPVDGSTFFNSSVNKEWRDMYYDRHPEAEKFFAQLGEVSAMPDKTWEDAQKIRRWWESHEELSEWLRRRETVAEKEFREIKESYFAILDRIPLTGSGINYWTRYFKVQKEADDFLAAHPELREWFAEHRKGDEEILKLQDEYFKIENPEKRNQFLTEHQELKDAWYNKAAPKKREAIGLQEAYFAIPKNDYSARNKFLADNPELLAYWNAQALPHEAYFEPKQFKSMNHSIELLEDYFDDLITSTADGEKTMRGLTDELRNDYLSGNFNEYMSSKIYLAAMQAWMKVINDNFLRGNYYFKSLPAWIRKRYFTAHPEKQFTFSIPLEDFITEPLKVWEKENPKLAWAYRIMYDYGNISQVPSELASKVEEIFINAGIWKDRKDWGKPEWRDYWIELAKLKHDIREADLERLPQLREAIARAAKQYPMKPRPRPLFRTTPRKGNLKPFI